MTGVDLAGMRKSLDIATWLLAVRPAQDYRAERHGRRFLMLGHILDHRVHPVNKPNLDRLEYSLHLFHNACDVLTIPEVHGAKGSNLARCVVYVIVNNKAGLKR